MFFPFPSTSPSTNNVEEYARSQYFPESRLDGHVGRVKDCVRSRSRSARRRLRDSSHSLVEHLRSVDGVYEVLTGSSDDGRGRGKSGFGSANDVGLCFGMRIPVMAGIRERILGLRRRAGTAPGRLEGADEKEKMV